jgi:hypothetical protein
MPPISSSLLSFARAMAMSPAANATAGTRLAASVFGSSSPLASRFALSISPAGCIAVVASAVTPAVARPITTASAAPRTKPQSSTRRSRGVATEVAMTGNAHQFTA